MKLHPYQQNCLADLREFLQLSAQKDAEEAYRELTGGRRYVPAPGGIEKSVPYVCVRVPTGGGKTLMAAHAVAVVAREYLDADNPVCLWIAPSTPIVEQTLRSLRTPGHPYRRALADAFVEVNCVSASEALRINKADMECGATVIVATAQSFNVEKTDGRKIYDNSGHLMQHFDSIPPQLLGGLEKLEEDGDVLYSLANALHLRSPIIISDEAHNARTDQFYKSLARFNPSCIVEWTATPQTKHNPDREMYASNVLSHVSARELKKAGMVKLPIHLEVNSDWRDNISAAIERRAHLENVAKKEGEYIRPIALYQAEAKGGDATKEKVEEALLELGVAKEEIAVHTGTRKELTGKDLFARSCGLRHIITVKSLAEGWDCSFAYVLCTMANLRSGRPVEQVLGRILRMPYAKSKRSSELGVCYAYSSSGSFYAVANALKDALVNGAGMRHLDDDEIFPKWRGEDGKLWRSNIGASHKLPPKIAQLKVPFLSVREDGELVFLEQSHFLDAKWSIARETPNMSAFEYEQKHFGTGTVDAEKIVRLKSEPGGAAAAKREQFRMLESDRRWTESTLAAWLDAAIEHPDIPQAQSSPFILAAVNQLREKFELSELARRRFHLKRTLEREIRKLRDRKRKAGYQAVLDGVASCAKQLEVSPKHSLVFDRNGYAMRWKCENSDAFGRHLFPLVGELKADGEEFRCAEFLDGMSEVEVWVRNLDRCENSFWLQTSSDKFYPDFVCRLTDGRILVVEYKNAERDWSNDDSKEKRAIGEMWARLSGGKCLFVMPKGEDWAAIRKCIGAGRNL